MNWSHFIWFAIATLLCWIPASLMAFSERKRKYALRTAAAGLCIFAVFIAGYWIEAGRPPLVSMGETRLWYSFFLLLCGLVVYARYDYKWILGFSTVLAGVFLALNLFKTEIHTLPLVPILQSVWFTPHVIVYIFAYGLLGIAFILSLYGLLRPKSASADRFYARIDTLTGIGTGFLLTGICFGALWAKQAWGYYWNWDPKETWALITLLCYALYLGLRQSAREFPRLGRKPALYVQLLGFVSLQICWYGINFLRAAQGLSVHTYA